MFKNKIFFTLLRAFFIGIVGLAIALEVLQNAYYIIQQHQTGKGERIAISSIENSLMGLTSHFSAVQKFQAVEAKRTAVLAEEDKSTEVQICSTDGRLFPVEIQCRIFDDEKNILETRYDHTEYRTETGDVINIPGIEAAGYFTRIEETENGCLYPAKKNGLWGYVYPSGEWAIQPQYVYAEPFQEGTAIVVLCDGEPAYTNTVFAYIDPFGQEIIRWKLPEMIGPFRDGTAIRYTHTDQDKTSIDIIDISGDLLASDILVDTTSLRPIKRLSPTAFLENEYYGQGQFLYETLSFSQGLIPVALDGKYGFLNTEGDWEIPPNYDYAKDFSEGRAIVGNGIGYLDRRYGFIDRSGELAVPMIYTKAWDFSEGKAAVQLDRESEKVQFIYPSGEFAFNGGVYSPLKGGLDADYDVYIFKEGLCVVYEESPDYCGVTFIDENGTNLREAWNLDIRDIGANGKVAYASAFRNGLALVSDGMKVWYINKEGEKILEYVEMREDAGPV